MSEPRFYVLETSSPEIGNATTDFLTADSMEDVPLGEAPTCPACGEYISMMRLLPPIEVEIELLGSSYGDFAFGPGLEFLVSERFKDAFLGAGLTGLPTFTPAKIVKTIFRARRFVGPAPKYFSVLPARSRAAIDDLASGVEYEERWTCATCRGGDIERYERIVLEQGSWSGEDIFFPRGLPGTVITSERFKIFCDRHAFTNCPLCEAEQYGYDFSPGVGRLRRK